MLRNYVTEYLKRPTSEWPINRDFSKRKDDCIPSNELLKQFRCLIQVTKPSAASGVQVIVDPWKTNSWTRVIRWTQNLLRWVYKARSLDTAETTIIQHAKRLWFLSAIPFRHYRCLGSW